jgi:glycosyltransferase involved in cell wall biosynthesis
MKVLYISYDGMTDSLGQSQVLPYLAGLAALGYSITIISAEKPANYANRKEDIKAFCQENKLQWHPLSYTKKPPIISTLVDIFRLYTLAKKLHRAENFDVLHCRSYIPSLIGLRFKRKFGTKFIFDMRGFWANERVDGNIWDIAKQPYTSIYNYFKRKEIAFINQADAIVSLTHVGKAEMLSWRDVQVQETAIHVIPCCVDTDRFNSNLVVSSKLDNVKSQLGLNGKFVLTYLGSIGTWYMLDEMLDFFKVLKRMVPNAVFLFVTGESEKYIYTQAKRMGVESEDLVVVKSDYADVPRYLSLSNASVFFIKPAYSKKASSPVKQGELMSMGIPIVCNSKVGDTDILVEKYNSGYLVHGFDETSYKHAITHLLENEFDAQQAIAGANDYFSLAKGILAYQKIYTAIFA